MLRCTFWPRFLGWLGIVGGLGWLTFFSPPVGYRFFMIVAPIGLLGAAITIGWLLTVGLDEEKWNALKTPGT